MTRVIALQLPQRSREGLQGVRPVDRENGTNAHTLPFAVTAPEERLPAGIEEEWASRIREGDAAAFESLFHAYYDRLCVHAERLLGSLDEAEEVVSEVFLRIWKRRGDWKLHGTVKSYLYRSVRNQALMRLEHREVRNRARATMMDRQDTVPAMPSPPASPDAVTELRELEKAVAVAIGELPARTRETYCLHREQGLSYVEIAEVMEVSIFTVKNQLSRALKLLREQLRPWIDKPTE